MGNHWPLVIAIGVISMAAALGIWQHDRAVEAAGIRVIKQPAPAAKSKPAVPAPLAKKAEPLVEAPAPAAPAPVALATPQPLPLAAPADNVPTRRIKAPVAALAPTAPVAAVAPTAPVAQLNPAPAAPAAAPVAREDRTKVLNDLKGALQKQFGIMPMELAAGGFALNTDGARIEVTPPPNWSASVYNINPKAPETETANFKVCMDLLIANFGIDMTQKPVEAGNGKTYLKTSSKMGSISMMRDPATGNSCMIRPIGQWTPTAAPANNNGAGVVQQPKVVRPVPVAPAAPPRPPATDANF
jgi:hypothetical protein